jgi:hypothetical protein
MAPQVPEEIKEAWAKLAEYSQHQTNSLIELVNSFEYLEQTMRYSYETFNAALEKIKEKFPAGENMMWDFNAETERVEKYNIPDMTWESFQEPNDELP